jgi:hypothetical protein
MMIPERPSLERRILAALDGSSGGGTRIPVVLGGCGSGRTALLLRLRDLIGRTNTQYLDIERIATTPERCLAAARSASPFPAPGRPPVPEPGAREAFDELLAFLDGARAPGDAPATFLLDEFLELRTFESFPGLRTVLRDLTAALARSANRFVLTSRYTARALRLLRDAPSQFEIVHVAPLTPAEIRATLAGGDDQQGASVYREEEQDRAQEELARLVQFLSDGRPSYARMILETTSAMSARGAADPVSALTALLAPRGPMSEVCRFSYELRLHRARGYGALKAILDVLAAEEPLTLTEIALRLRRTPGSTKDYLSWLEDVDLIVSRQKRYSFADPVMRLWVRLNGHPAPPTEEEIAREVQAYVMARIPQNEPALAIAGGPQPAAAREKGWGIIEID